jgi:hypothetical protein
MSRRCRFNTASLVGSHLLPGRGIESGSTGRRNFSNCRRSPHPRGATHTWTAAVRTRAARPQPCNPRQPAPAFTCRILLLSNSIPPALESSRPSCMPSPFTGYFPGFLAVALRGEYMSNCNRISALASVQELVKLMAELDDLRSRVRQAEAATVLAGPPRNGLPSGEQRWH